VGTDIPGTPLQRVAGRPAKPNSQKGETRKGVKKILSTKKKVMEGKGKKGKRQGKGLPALGLKNKVGTQNHAVEKK